MRTRKKLPARLGANFSVSAARMAGVGRSRRDADDLHRAYRGVRSTSAPMTFRATVDCYLPRLRSGQAFAGRTAARLWGLPVPWRWTKDENLDIAVPLHLNPPKLSGIRGRRLGARKVRHWTIAGARAVDAVAAVFTCASELTVKEAVTLIDALLADARNYPGLVGVRPFATKEDLISRLCEWGRFPGCATVREALSLARERVESPKETETRLLIVAAGLSEPVVQHDVYDGGKLVARVDLAYPELKVAIEYEGDGHRTDKEQWRTDIRRQRELEDLGWIVIRLTQADLKDEGSTLLTRLRNAIARRP